MTPLKTTALSGSAAAVAVTLAASLAGRRATGAYAAPLNATSHFLWMFWALFAEALKGPSPSAGRALGLAVSWKR